MSDNIIAMAKEAGFFVSGGWAYSSAGKGHHINESLSRFRDLVLEEAAKACDDYDCGTSDGRDIGGMVCAGIIRDMKGEKP